MSLLASDYDGLSEPDFDVYRSECWSSNRFNLQRMKTKEKVSSLAKSLSSMFDAADFHMESSSEIPSVWNGRCVKDQWSYWLRNPNAQRQLQPILAKRLDLATRIKAPADHLKHVLLCVRLDHESLAVGLRLSRYASVDLANLLSRAQSDPDTFAKAVEAVSDHVLFDGEAVSEGALLRGATELQVEDREWLDLVHVIPRDAILDGATDVVEAVGQSARSLLPLMRFILWSPTNDHIDGAQALSHFEQQTEARSEAKKSALEEKQQQHAERAERARDRTNAKVDAEAAWRRMQAKRRSEGEESRADASDEKKESEHAATSRPASRKRQSAAKTARGAQRAPTRKPSTARSSESKRTTKPKPKRQAAPAHAFTVGDACVLTRGIFAGKSGAILAEDKPGYYKVKVGMLEVTVSAHDLQPTS